MKTNLRNILAVAVLSIALAMPPIAMPQARRGDPQRNHTERPATPGGSNRPARPQPNRPQPGKPGNDRPARPQPNRPKPGKPGNDRPARPQPNKPKPNRPVCPQPNKPKPNRPAPPPQHGRPAPPPPRNWNRPAPPPPNRYRVPRPIPRRPAVPPPGYRPYVHAPALRSILGITFGTVYGTALSYLLNNGYAIDGYADGTIYLSDVTLLGAGWPLATLYCNGTGGLTSAQFSYYSGYNSMARYDQVYRLLCGTYGTPLSLTANGIARRVMWYGGGGTGYVTLEFDFYNGSYYTTLSVSSI